MYSDDEKVVLCGASAYEHKYYFNQDFSSLPQSVQDELHVMCVMFTVEIGGIFTLWFDGEGNLQFETEAVDADAMYDEIGSCSRTSRKCCSLWNCITGYFSLGKSAYEAAEDWKCDD